MLRKRQTRSARCAEKNTVWSPGWAALERGLKALGHERGARADALWDPMYATNMRRERTAMKVAVATDGPEVAAHFGRCEGYIIADVDDGQVGETEYVANPGHEPGRLPAMLNGMGVQCILAGGMGNRAVVLLDEYGIKAISGVQGSVETALAQLAEGTLQDGESTCLH